MTGYLSKDNVLFDVSKSFVKVNLTDWIENHKANGLAFDPNPFCLLMNRKASTKNPQVTAENYY